MTWLATELGEKLRRVEALIEVGCATRDIVRLLAAEHALELLAALAATGQLSESLGGELDDLGG